MGAGRASIAAAPRTSGLARGLRLAASPGLLRSAAGEVVDFVRVHVQDDAPATGVAVVDHELGRVRLVDLLAGEIGDENGLACHRRYSTGCGALEDSASVPAFACFFSSLRARFSLILSSRWSFANVCCRFALMGSSLSVLPPTLPHFGR